MQLLLLPSNRRRDRSEQQPTDLISGRRRSHRLHVAQPHRSFPSEVAWCLFADVPQPLGQPVSRATKEERGSRKAKRSEKVYWEHGKEEEEERGDDVKNCTEWQEKYYGCIFQGGTT